MSYRDIQSSVGHEDRDQWSHISLAVASNVQKLSQNVNQIQQIVNQLEASEDIDLESIRSQIREVKSYTSQWTREMSLTLKELSQLSQLPQLVPTLPSAEHNRRNQLINSLNASNLRKTIDENTSKQFSVEKFMTPSTLLSKKSHFYEGKTVFGGANTSRAARLAGTTPYNLLHRSHLAPVVKVDVKPPKRLVQSNEPLSSSSQRILEKLEKASTPLQDARRIPSSYQKSYFQSSESLHLSTKRPKMSSIPVLSHKPMDKSFQPKQHFELKLSDIEKKMSANDTINTTKQSMSSMSSCDNRFLKNSNENKTIDSFVPKLTRKETTREDRRIKTQVTKIDDDIESLELLSSAKPLTMPSSLPTFEFGSKTSAQNRSQLTTIITKVSDAPELKFKFSEPVLKTRDQKPETVSGDESNLAQNEKPFVFSSPQSAITTKPSSDSEKAGKVSNVSKESLNESDNKINAITKDISYPNDKKVENIMVPKKSVSNLEKWVCVCLFQNNGSDNKCKACNKERSSQHKQSTPPLIPKPNPISVINPLNIATTGPPVSQNASTGWGNKFKPPTDSWSCPTCMVTNKGDAVKCVACEEPKPGGAQPKESTDSSKSKSETWQCFYCKHSNDISKNMCKSCNKIKTTIATKAGLDKLYAGQTFKFGITEEKKKDVKIDDQKNEIFNKPTDNNLFSKSMENTSQNSTPISNAFVFGSTDDQKNRLSSDLSSTKADVTITSTQPSFKFGAPPESPKASAGDKSKDVSTAADIFSSIKSSATTPTTFIFGAPPPTSSTSIGGQESGSLTKPSTESSLFAFGVQNKEQNLFKNSKTVSLDSEQKSEETDNSTNKLGSDQTKTNFQITKPKEDKPLFKAFGTSANALFGGTTSSPISTVTTTTTSPSITSFMDNKFTPLKANETKSIASLFGGPTTTTSSSTSFSSPFSLTNSFSSGQTPTTTAGQSTSEGSKSLFSMTTSSNIKSFDSMISSQTNPLLSNSLSTPTAPLNSSTSSSQQKGLVFGNANTNLQSFSSQASTATTKPNFSFNMGANTSAITTTTTSESTFSSNTTTNSLFGSNTNALNKGFNFGNSSLSNSQTPAFSFTIPSNNSIQKSTPNISFGQNSNPTTSADNKTATKSLFSFGAQNSGSDQFSSTSAQSAMNSADTSLKSGPQFSFGLSSNQPNSSQPNLFANAISSAQNNLSFNQMAPTATAGTNQSPFSFSGFGANQSTPSMPQIQTQPQQQQQQPPINFNFSSNPQPFNFGQTTTSTQSPGGGIFQFSAEPTTQAVAPNRNIKKAKRRLQNPT